MKKIKIRTIDRITFPKTCKTVESETLIGYLVDKEAEFFDLRHRIEEGLQSGAPECACFYCQKPVKLVCASVGKQIYYFKHVHRAGACPKKSHKSHKRSKSEGEINAEQYQGAEEGRLHKETKEFLAAILKTDAGVLEVKVELRLSDSKNPRSWRRPDIYVRKPDMTLAIEVQRSKTYNKVIVGRERFYQRNGIHLLWVLTQFSEEDETFMGKAICYSNNRCVFVLDEEAKQESKDRKELILACYRRETIGAVNTWKREYVRFGDLVFEPNSYKVYHGSPTR